MLRFMIGIWMVVVGTASAALAGQYPWIVTFTVPLAALGGWLAGTTRWD